MSANKTSTNKSPPPGNNLGNLNLAELASLNSNKGSYKSSDRGSSNRPVNRPSSQAPGSTQSTPKSFGSSNTSIMNMNQSSQPNSSSSKGASKEPSNNIFDNLFGDSKSGNRVGDSKSGNSNKSASSADSAGESIFSKIQNTINNNLARLNTATENKAKKKLQVEAEKAAQGSTGAGESDLDMSRVIIGENYMLVMGVTMALVLLVLMYLLSKTFNVGRALERIRMYELYQKITNLSMKVNGDLRLKQVHVASSYNSCHSGYQMGSYTSEEILKQVIKSGARYIEFNIFPSKYGQGAIPIISNGYRNGQWKLMLNTTTFEAVVKTIAENAFRVADKLGGAPNPNDPLFLSLNLSTGHNIPCLDLMADIILDYLHTYLLEPKYAFQFSTDIQNIKMSDLQNKVVILASPGFEGSKLEELINSSWIDETNPTNNPNILVGTEGFKVNKKADPVEEIENTVKSESRQAVGRKSGVRSSRGGNVPSRTNLPKGLSLDKEIEEEFREELANGDDGEESGARESMADVKDTADAVYNALNDGTARKNPRIIRISAEVFNKPGFDGDRIKRHNENGLTIVVPHIEGDIFTSNYNTDRAFELGCQFVAMNYQVIDEPMDGYITKFEKKAILPIK